MHHCVILGAVAVVGLVAVGLALFSLFDEEKPHSSGRPRRRPSSPPRRRSPSPPWRRPSSPPRRRSPSPPWRRHRSPPRATQSPPPTRPLYPLSSPSRNPTSSDHPESPPSNLRLRKMSNENNLSNSPPKSASNYFVPKESSSLHEGASGSQDIRASQNENGSSHCYHDASGCINCGDKYADLITFSPCMGSYFCKECAMHYLKRNDHCSLCRSRITSME